MKPTIVATAGGIAVAKDSTKSAIKPVDRQAVKETTKPVVAQASKVEVKTGVRAAQAKMVRHHARHR